MNLFNVSKLGFGTSQIGGPTLIKGKLGGVRAISKGEAINILRYAYENGINFFDTSDKYGNAEELLGEFFSKIRDKVIIATKCGLTDDGDRNFSISYIESCLENSLRRLRTDYIDIFQLAKPDVGDVTDKLLLFFERKIKEGKIKYFGISVAGDDDGQVYLAKKTIKSFQIFYNLLFPTCHELIKRCVENNKFVIIRSPLNSGILSGRYTMNTKFDEVDSRNKIFYGELLRERLECVEEIKEHFNLSEDEILAFSLNFIFSNNNVNVVIPAASRLEQLKEYIEIFNRMKRFNETELIEILNFLQNEICHESSGQFK